MAQINLTARDIDLIGRLVDTEVPRSVARKNPAEYNKMVAAVVDTVMNRVATQRYGATIQDVIDQPRAFSKIGGPARLDPYGTVTRAPKASQQTQEVVNDHLKGRMAGMPDITAGGLDYANPNVADRKNVRGWIQPMIDAGAKMFGIGRAVHYHGVAPGNFPAPPTNIYGPAGFAPHRGPTGPVAQLDPMRPDEANAAGPKGHFNVLADYSAPLGIVEKGPALGPASLPPDRQMPSGPIPGSFSSISPRDIARQAVNAPIDAMGGLGSVLAKNAVNMAPAPAQQPTFAPPTETISPVPGMPSLPSPATQDVISPMPGAPASTTVDPTGTFPDAPPGPSTFSKIKDVASPIAKDAMLGLKVAGPIGALAAPAIGWAADKMGIGLSHLGPGFDNAVQDRFSTGFGLSGIMGAMGGPKGAQGFSLSNPGSSFTSLGNGMGLRRSDKYGYTEVVGPDGAVRGIKYDNPQDKGILGKISNSMNGRFGGGLSEKGSKAIAGGKGGLY